MTRQPPPEAVDAAAEALYQTRNTFYAPNTTFSQQRRHRAKVILAAAMPALERELREVIEANLRRIASWHHAGLWNAACPGSPTNLHWTRPGQLEAKCAMCGFALVAMDADGVAIRLVREGVGNLDARLPDRPSATSDGQGDAE